MIKNGLNMEKIDLDLFYSDDYLKTILSDVKTIAMVGASSNWNRPSFFAMKYILLFFIGNLVIHSLYIFREATSPK